MAELAHVDLDFLCRCPELTGKIRNWGMKLSYKWLKKFIDFELSPQELASMLISVGIETSVVSTGCDWHSVVTVKVLEVLKHPGADRLSLCKVNDGSKDYSIVCGAKNIAAGQIVPLAKIGAVLPGNFKINKSKIRGIVSEGMICSEADLGLKKESDGILMLDKNTKMGVALENVLSGLDSILEIEITTNRGDCLSHLGVAREIGAKLRKILSFPTMIKTFNIPYLNCVEVKSDLCHRYIGSVISGVKICPSPGWITDALEKSGIRPVNNVVDVTNYVMIELGQPLHTFDITKLSSRKVVVRKAVDYEKIIALDGKEYKLDSEMLVIADSEKPVAIAGVMGGEYSAIDEKTETVFLESAIFDAVSIRKTSKKLNLSSGSSYRFERGLGWDITELASWRAANLIIEIAGGRMDAREDLQIVKYERADIALRVEKVSKILGCAVKEAEITEILRFLGIDLRSRGTIILCTVPSWRNDIKKEVDLIEEIARIKGYDAITSPGKRCTATAEVCVPDNSLLHAVVEEFRVKLNGFSFSEVLNYSFSEITELEKFDLKYYYKIANPISKENEVLRPSLLPALYKNLLLNIEWGSETVTLFEYGKIFTGLGERKAFAVIMYGKVWQEWWKWAEQKNSPKYDFYFGGGIVRNILPSDEFIIAENLNAESYYHSGKTASVVYKGKPVGQFGVLKPSITSDIAGDVFYFEVNLESFENVCTGKKSLYKAYSKFPEVKRDISITADKTLQFSEIEKVIKNVIKSGGILKEYSLFSVYSDESKIGDGKISYSFRLSYKNSEKTLTNEEVNKDMNVLLQKLDADFGVKLRR
ncbi:MAG: phenylalanine--tRNA ligase subunit beta [Candidatus Endomicrobiellum trichonymphae]|uniref:phenylalanine--tRNA ligase subunit beta n=1 Tax=Endomicrobium trichonymphae TaxID=1408204 RepID=UPI0027D3D281|nr:MAG: phenylalanine--tRNA ligase subunit beta [Candidatus Endomicrobium trichonymphae]